MGTSTFDIYTTWVLGVKMTTASESLKLVMTPALCAALRQTYDRALKHQAGFIWTKSVDSSERSVNGP